ncbi:hypothetical protein QBC34DRAFT_406642 [Podospora aff. communis PSN243]|uniref:NACHT domain-containing protein n=1 Tax=Podospora aff. communis PSN243 TaxID=3040156 RepID=A0AAV9GMZ6_9PEZI|nr:hypothetical protein QBC34DRAFT_406642 [Podospora aff. communis PSN243]
MDSPAMSSPGRRSLATSGNVTFGSIEDNSGVIAASLHNSNVIGTQKTTNNYYPKPIERVKTTVEVQAKVLNWLCPLTTKNKLTAPAEDRRVNKSHPNAGQRFLDSDAFTRWLADSDGDPITRLWCFGSPGAGKTFLASRVQQHLRTINSEFQSQGGKSGVAFLYLNYQFPTTTDQLLGCIIRQLIESQPNEPLPEGVKLQCESHKGTTMLPRDLVTLLEKVTAGRLVHVVVDALDECPANTRSEIMGILKSLGGKLRWMITSRFVEDFELLFAGFHRVKISANPDDVSDYIEHCIDESPRLREFTRLDTSLKADIHKQVLAKSQDMFLLVRLHMESLEAAVLSDEVRDLLNDLSDNIDTIYDEILNRIERQVSTGRNIATKTIRWVASAARPLSIEELQHALAVEIGETALRPGRKPLIDDILGFCCGLIVIGQSNTAQLVHYTASTYIRNSDRTRDLFRGAHTMIAGVCATYMCIPRLEMPDDPARQMSYAIDLYDDPDDYSDPEIFAMQRNSINPECYEEKGKPLSFWTKIRAYPLVRYAAVYLGYHLRSMADLEADGARRALDLTKRMLNERPKRNFYNRLLFSAEAYPPTLMDSDFFDHYPAGSATDDDYSEYTDSDLEMESEDEESDQSPTYDGLSALFDSDSQSSDDKSRTSSSMSSHVPDSPLSAGPDIHSLPAPVLDEPKQETPAYREITPLHIAAQIGMPTLVQAFLDDDPTMLQAEDQYGLTPLVVALRCGHADSATVLLDAGASIDIKSKLGRMALLYMVQSIDGCDSLAACVLDRAACVSIAPSTPTSGPLELWLCFLAWASSLCVAAVTLISSIVKASQTQAMNIGNMDSSHDIPWSASEDDYLKLTSAAYRGDRDTIHTLIHNNRILVEEQLNETVLHHLATLALFLAVEGGHGEVVRLLVGNGVGANSTDYNRNTPLHRAAARKNAEMVQTLLDLGADLWAEDRWRNTPWDVAARSQCHTVCRILIENGANVNHQGEDGVHLIYQAAAGGNATSVKFLLDLGVNPSIVTDFGWAPLHWAANNGHTECVIMLLDSGADVNPVSDQYKTPLDMAINQGREEIEAILRGKGGMVAREVLLQKGHQAQYWYGRF